MTDFARNRRKDKRRFISPFNWRHPDVASYEAQKNLKMIQPDDLDVNIGGPFPEIPRELLGDSSLLCELWGRFWGYRIAGAASSPYQPFGKGHYPEILSVFPGPIVPGMLGGERKVGSLAIDRFENIIQLEGGFPRKINYSLPTIQGLPLEEDWPWEEVEQPRLKILVPSANKNGMVRDGDVMALRNWLNKEVEGLIKRGKPRELLALIRRVWSPYTKEHVFAPETIKGSKNIINQMKVNSRKEKRNWLALAFEVEAVLSQIEYSWGLNVTGYGKYGGNWIEVGRLPISDIQSTELVVSERILAELVNIQTKGFAPIVVNEYRCNTDGTHRYTAAWIWNLLDFCISKNYVLDFEYEAFQNNVGEFIGRHGREMGPVVIREALRALAVILRDEEMMAVMKRDVLPHVNQYYPVTHLPVTLLTERSCGAVIKGPYDAGEASYRVDPLVYELLANNPDYVLPARGPYHLTDRALLPWFKVLDRR